jgi:tetratricopeptide (TPR) repeat protein
MKKTKKTEDRRQTTEGRVQGSSRGVLLPVVLSLIIIGALIALAYVRNSIYHNHVTLWADITKRSPNKRRAHENYGQALSTVAASEARPTERRQLLDKALHEFQTVLALPDDGSVPQRDLYRELGVVYFRLERYDDAITAWQKGLQNAPNDPSLLNNLSVVMMQTNRYDEAAHYAKTALAGAPSMPQALNTMGQVYLIKKDYEKAAQYFLRALEVEPDVPQRYWNAALALEQTGKYDMAFQYASRYAAMEPDRVMRERAYGYLEHLKQVMGR